MSQINNELSKIKHLMNYGLNENAKPKYNSIEYTNKGADGKMYGIIREGSKFYIKQMHDSTKKMIPENFDYIGGFSNRKDNEFSTYANALKQFDLKMLSLKESFNSKAMVVESLDPSRKEYLIVEGTEEMKNEIARQKQIMLNAALISENKKKCVGCCSTGDAKKQGAPYGLKDKGKGYVEVEGDAYNEKGEPIVKEEVLGWNDNKDYMDKSSSTEIGCSAPFCDKANDGKDNHASHNSDTSNEAKNGTVMESKPAEPAPNEVNDWDKGLPEKEGVGEVGDSTPFDKKVNESIFEDEDIDNVEGDVEPLDIEDSETETIEDTDDMSELKSLMQQVLDRLSSIEDSISSQEFDDEPLYDDTDETSEDDDDFGEDDDEFGDEDDFGDTDDFDDEDDTTYFESINYRKAMIREGQTLNDFGKHPAYRKKVMTLPNSKHQEMDGYKDWNDESVEGEKPYGEQIGDSAPFDITPEAIDNAIAESIERLKNKKKR